MKNGNGSYAIINVLESTKYEEVMYSFSLLVFLVQVMTNKFLQKSTGGRDDPLQIQIVARCKLFLEVRKRLRH